MAQWIEHRTSNPAVVGSSPTGRAKTPGQMSWHLAFLLLCTRTSGMKLHIIAQSCALACSTSRRKTSSNLPSGCAVRPSLSVGSAPQPGATAAASTQGCVIGAKAAASAPRLRCRNQGCSIGAKPPAPVAQERGAEAAPIAPGTQRRSRPSEPCRCACNASICS